MGLETMQKEADIMPRSLAVTIVAGTMLGGIFWASLAALIIR